MTLRVPVLPTTSSCTGDPIVAVCSLDSAGRSDYLAARIAEPHVARRVWMEEALQALPEDGDIHEVVDGELLMSPTNDPYHGNICAELLTAWSHFAKAHRLGAVWDSSTGFWMHNRNCRAPDISFIT